jgi:hypothetical protein
MAFLNANLNYILFRAILELEMERLSLKQKIFELNFTLEDQELFFNAQVLLFCKKYCLNF